MEAENYDVGGEGVAYHDTDPANNGGAYRNDGVDVEACSEGGYDVGWTAAGEYLKYGVNVATAGTYTVGFRVASITSGNTFHLENSTGTNLSGTVTCPNTGGWQAWQTVNATVTLPAGTQTLKLVEDTGGYNINFLTFTAAGGATVNTLFTTGFESGDPLPTWNSSPDTDYFPGATNVSGFSSSVGPECAVRGNGDWGPINAHTGSQMLMVAGTANGGSSTFCYYKVFDLSSNPVTIQSNSTLSYWINPVDINGDGSDDNGRYIAVDFHCTDGTTLRDSGIKDSSGNGLHPNAGHGGSIPLNTWTQISASLGSLAGKKVDRIWVGFDRPGATGQYRAYIDDLTIDPPTGQTTVATPTFSPAGGTYTGTQSVSLSSSTSGATLYYTTDGTAPTTASTKYTGAITVSSSKTIKAIAVKSGSTNSGVASAAYTINAAPSVPAAPASLAATAGNAQVSLTWAASSGAFSYSLFRGTAAGGEAATAVKTGITGTSYTDSGLTNGATYFYKLKAVNSAGTSSYSNEASAKPVAPAATVTVDDATVGTGVNQFSYVGSGWQAQTGYTGYGYYNNSEHYSNHTGDYFTVKFTGTKIAFYAGKNNGNGIAGVSIDGGTEVQADTYANVSDQGNVLVYTSAVLASGSHMLKVRVTGSKNASSSGTYISPDRVVITP